MTAVASGELLEHLALEYPELGRPQDLAPLSYDFRVSNSLFLYRTTGGRFLLKAMLYPQALYGQPDVAERLESVGYALRELHAAGLPVEELIPGREGRCVHQYGDRLLRVYAFDPGRPFLDPEADARRAARSLRRLHRDGLRCLSEATRHRLARYERPYSLGSTSGQAPVLRAFVEEQSAGSQTFAAILAQWGMIEWALGRTVAHRRLTVEADCVVHTDFHPRNALFTDGKDEAMMVDCDNMMIDRRLNCLGFAILRFAFFEGQRTVETFRNTLALFALEDGRDPAFIGDLLHAMVSLELEKVLRILHRVMTTGQYAGFVDNIVPLHLANLQFLRGSGAWRP
jgi:Ser/Thr protein kinase RdoA (MazF antagonist)